jgi:DNA mismatch repair protein MutS2
MDFFILKLLSQNQNSVEARHAILLYKKRIFIYNFVKKETVFYPTNFEEKISFIRIREMVEGRCLGSLGIQIAKEMSFSSDFKKLQRTLQQTDEFRRVLISGRPFPSQDYIDLTDELDRIKTPGAFIFTNRLFDLLISLKTINECLQYFKSKEADLFPLLTELGRNIFVPTEIIAAANKIINEKGVIKDSASEQLHTICRELSSKKDLIGKRISQIMKKLKTDGMTRDNAEVSIRDGHLVIPVHAVNKRKIKGYVHDESATGLTVYIEPAEIVDLGNELRELELAEKREIIRILTTITDQIRPWIDDLQDAYLYLGYIDFLRAKSLFALDIGGVLPELQKAPVIDWRKAYHPLLLISHKAQHKNVEHLSITLNQQNRILIISGPNAGGKSVCLKTVGILQYMLQCGLLIPVHESSVAGLFKELFIDIGDEQSLDNDLSTYSSHLINLKHLLSHAHNQMLFMIDEFGAGTEPQLGGAIAEAVLENLNGCEAYGVVTTHYANLKMLGGKLPGVINGAMQFDIQNIQPLYQLQIGKPGSSFAFEIARKIGFPEAILEKAILKTGTTQIDFDTQLQALELERISQFQKRNELESADELITEIIEKYRDRLHTLEVSSKEIIENAKNQAKEIVQNANKLIENAVREIREEQANKEKTKIVREKIESFKVELEEKKPEDLVQTYKQLVQEIQREAPKKEVTNPPITGKLLKPGDFVHMPGQMSVGQITKILRNKAEVLFGQIKLTTEVDKLEKVLMVCNKKEKEISQACRFKGVMSDINDKMATFKLQLDLRGKRVDEALDEMRHYIDDAILLSVSEVRILHGKGNGTLRHFIREYLSSVPEIKKFKDAATDMGGTGITIASLR